MAFTKGIRLTTNANPPNPTLHYYTNANPLNITGYVTDLNGNYAILGGSDGVWSINNSGTIWQAAGSYAIFLQGSGSVTNGASGATTALISGPAGISIGGTPGAGGTVTNFGTIVATNASGATTGRGVSLTEFGTLTNGAPGSTAALISGNQQGVYILGGAAGIGGLVTNFGTIVGTRSGAGGNFPDSSDGVQLGFGGSVTNGASGATAAIITGIRDGIRIPGGNAGTVTNFGTIAGLGGGAISDGIGIDLFGNGGIVANGQSGGTGGLISGLRYGVITKGAGSVPIGIALSNFGTIAGTGVGGIGVKLSNGGVVTNGAGGSPGASISGQSDGIFAIGGYSAITNFGTIAGPGDAGVRINAGNVSNGASNSTTAIITGGSYGALMIGYGQFAAAETLTNFATIAAIGTGGIAVRANGNLEIIANLGAISAVGAGGVGVRLVAGSVTNGAIGATTAAITGASGGVLFASGFASTLTNFGTISGTGDAAVRFGAGNDRLIDEPGAAFNGTVDGGAGSNTLELAVGNGAAGSVAGLGTNFLNFGTLTFDPGAQWSVEGAAAGFPATLGGFSAGDAITVDGFVAVSDTFASNALVLTDSGNNHVTLGLAGNYWTGEFALGSANGGTGTTIRLVGNPYDFTGDGSGDVLVQSGAGQIDYANMLGGVFQNWAAAGYAPGWNVVGEGRISGNPSADVVIQNPGSGQIAYADLVNGGFGGWVGVATTPGYNVVGVGDINGDRFADVVVESGGGNIVYANLNGGVFSGWVGVGVTPGWNVDGVADVNGDGFADVVIQNPMSGQIAYANMAGGAFSGWVGVGTAPGWNVVGAGDINRDGFADIVVQNPMSGQIAYANMAGGALTGWVGVATAPGFTVTAVEDVVGNGYDDIVVQNPNTGEIDFANMTGGTFQGWGAVATTPGFTAHTGPAASGGGAADLGVPADSGSAVLTTAALHILTLHPGALE